MPVLTVVTDDLLVYRVPGEQRVEPFCYLGAVAPLRRGEDQSQFVAEQPQRFEVARCHLARQVRPVCHEGPVGLHGRQPVVAAAALTGAVRQAHG